LCLQAKLISFNPLRAEDVKIPAGGVFVITNSCVKAEKAATSYYNTRVAECKIGVQVCGLYFTFIVYALIEIERCWSTGLRGYETLI